jgi:hypothetical protein
MLPALALFAKKGGKSDYARIIGNKVKGGPCGNRANTGICEGFGLGRKILDLYPRG